MAEKSIVYIVSHLLIIIRSEYIGGNFKIRNLLLVTGSADTWKSLQGLKAGDVCQLSGEYFCHRLKSLMKGLQVRLRKMVWDRGSNCRKAGLTLEVTIPVNTISLTVEVSREVKEYSGIINRKDGKISLYENDFYIALIWTQIGTLCYKGKYSILRKMSRRIPKSHKQE